MLTTTDALSASGLDGVALKPTEVDLRRALEIDVDTITVDYEGQDALPSAETLAALADGHELRVTTPVRADGFDPHGDDSLLDAVPAGAGRVLVAGHPAYLTDAEASRAIAPRLRDAVATSVDPWVGTEGIERLAMAVGGTQFELLSPTTERDCRTLRAGGYDGEIAVYAPTVLTDTEDAVLDALGDYVARRSRVREALPDGGATDASATGRAREVLSQAVRDYGLVGQPEQVRERIATLCEAGVDRVVGYPARGLDQFAG